MYIGSSVIIEKRQKEHWLALRKNLHANRYLQFSVNKYGIDNFEFKVLESEVVDHNLIIREQYWIDTLKTVVPNGYNLKPLAASNLGMKHTEKANEKNRQAHLNIPLSDETKAKMSAVRKGRKQSPEWIAARTKGMIESFKIKKLLSNVIIIKNAVLPD